MIQQALQKWCLFFRIKNAISSILRGSSPSGQSSCSIAWFICALQKIPKCANRLLSISRAFSVR
jgi:hypothetical protein